MAQKLLKLPIGIQTLDDIINDSYIYVDKTKYLIDLIEGGKVYFLSRPRRFGKSLTISTFDALFSGKKELFKGLYAEEFFERPGYRTYPVLRFDMSKVTTNKGLDIMELSMLRQVKHNAALYGVDIHYDSPSDALGELMITLGDRGETAVILVDEYDKPILDALDDKTLANQYRDSLRMFYTQIKAEDASIKFVFITGITKFTKTGVFSAMNNLKDISMMPKYGAMFGYTQEELESNFEAHIGRSCEKLSLTCEKLLEEVKDYYDGFCFDGKHRVYNPFSTLNFFDESCFKNFWFESGSPSFLIKYAKEHDLSAEDFRGKIEHENFTSVTEIELAKPSSFLFQAGYLTVREKTGEKLVLDYPNKEVLSSMSALLLYNSLNNPNTGIIRLELEEALAKGEPEAIITAYNRVLAAIPYDIYNREENKYEEEAKKAELSLSNLAESFYHSILFTLLWASGAATIAENHSYKGRSDVEVHHKGHVYVIELKVSNSKEEAEKAADAALAQIYIKGYADKHPSAQLLGIAVDRSQRRVGAYRIKKVNRDKL